MKELFALELLVNELTEVENIIDSTVLGDNKQFLQKVRNSRSKTYGIYFASAKDFGDEKKKYPKASYENIFCYSIYRDILLNLNMKLYLRFEAIQLKTEKFIEENKRIIGKIINLLLALLKKEGTKPDDVASRPKTRGMFQRIITKLSEKIERR